jgi:hypothetical protein
MDTATRLTHEVPTSEGADRAIADGEELQLRLWRLAGEALDAAPISSAPRLYVESLNSMIDSQGVRIAANNNRVPGAVLLLGLVGAAIARGGSSGAVGAPRVGAGVDGAPPRPRRGHRSDSRPARRLRSASGGVWRGRRGRE